MSSRPNSRERAAGKRPTGDVPPTPASTLLQMRSLQSLPQGYSNPSAPRAAASHSYSPGKRPPAQAANACASQNETQTTGWLGPFHFALRQKIGSDTSSSLRQRHPSSDHQARFS